MSANTWFVIAVVGFSLSGAALIAAIILFIRLDIPAIIGDLTGRTVAREIKAMRDANASSGDKRFRSSAVNLQRGTLTEKVAESSAEGMAVAHASKRLDKSTGELDAYSARQSKGGTIGLSDAARSGSDAGPTEVLDAGPTEVLDDRTEVLRGDDTEVLHAAAADATEVLQDVDASPDAGATEVLTAETEVLTPETEVLGADTTVLSVTEKLDESETGPVAFRVTQDEMVVHTDESIR